LGRRRDRRVRVTAADFERIGVNLHDFCVDRRDLQSAHLVAGVAADEQHQFGTVHDAIGRGAE